MGGNNEFFENFERNKNLKKLPSMQRVKNKCFKGMMNIYLIKVDLYVALFYFILFNLI